MNRILFLDLGTKTGWAYSLGDNEIESGVQDFSAFAKNRRLLYEHFSRWLNKMVLRGEPDFPGDTPDMAVTVSPCFGAICCEKTFRSRFLFTLRKRVERFCKLYGIEFTTVDNKTLKKFWTGKGNSDKPAMIAECQKHGFVPIDDNEADAIAGLHWAINEYGGQNV